MAGLRFPKRKLKEVTPPLTSLIDIVFLLLVFFLLTTNFISDEGIDVSLPQAASSRVQEGERVTIDIDAQGTIFWTGRETNMEELGRKLPELVIRDASCVVVVRADRNVVLDRVVAVMDAARTAGVERLCLATRSPE